MPAISRRVKAIGVMRRRRSLAPMATLAGMTALAVTGVAAASAVLVLVATSYAAGLVLGAGLMSIAWVVARARQRLVLRPRRSSGRSPTLGCRRARWEPSVTYGGKPRLPAPEDRRVRPCPGSHRR